MTIVNLFFAIFQAVFFIRDIRPERDNNNNNNEENNQCSTRNIKYLLTFYTQLRLSTFVRETKVPRFLCKIIMHNNNYASTYARRCSRYVFILSTTFAQRIDMPRTMQPPCTSAYFAFVGLHWRHAFDMADAFAYTSVLLTTGKTGTFNALTADAMISNSSRGWI